MSIIATVVKGALVLDQKVQAVVHKLAHSMASDYFKWSQNTENKAIEEAEAAMLRVERDRAAGAALLIKRHKESMIRLHASADGTLELIDGRKAQMLAKAAQQRQTATACQGTAIRADLAGEAARKAAEQLS